MTSETEKVYEQVCFLSPINKNTFSQKEQDREEIDPKEAKEVRKKIREYSKNYHPASRPEKKQYL